MYLKTCWALFLLALVACQAAPSPKVIEKSISEAETTFAKNAVLEEETGADKGRAKKSATTFCVEVHSGKQEKVPCRQEVRQELVKPVVYVQPVPVPAPVVEFRKPIAIPPPLPPSPSITLNQQQQQSSQAVNYPPPAPHPAPVPAPAPVQTPAPASIPIINIVPQAPASAPCDRPIVQPQQSQQIHTVHHVIHPQSQPPQRPSVTVIQPQKPEKPALPKPQNLPILNQELNCSPQRPTCRKCNGLLPPSEPLSFIVQPVQPRPVFFNVRSIDLKDRYDNQQTNEDSYDCNCRSGDDSSIPTLTPYITSGFHRAQEPRTIVHHGGATFESPMPYRSAMMSTENNHRMMPDQPIISPSEETHRGMEGRHKKQYSPINLSVQFPIVYPESGNSPKYYEPGYQPTYTNPPTYAYPSSYQVYGNGNYGSSYPVSYGSQASGVPAITVNAGGPFYRESQHTDSSSQFDEIKMLPGEAHSAVTDMIDASNNQKREVDTATQSKNEQEKIAQKEK